MVFQQAIFCTCKLIGFVLGCLLVTIGAFPLETCNSSRSKQNQTNVTVERRFLDEKKTLIQSYSQIKAFSLLSNCELCLLR